MNKIITVYTPAYNRAATLPRVYESLKNQTKKDFIWLIVDDGSRDETENLINKWKKEATLEINYIKKGNEGKTLALNSVYNYCQTKYIIGIDSDDELTEDAVKIFYDEWKLIEDKGLEDTIASIRALNMNSKKNITYGYGSYIFPPGIDYLDASWQEFVLKLGNNNECIVSENLAKIKECASIQQNYWLSENVRTIGDFNLAARLGRKYKSRLINKVLGIVHYDAIDSLSRTKDITNLHYNSIVGNYFFLNENMDYYSWNRKYFIHSLLRFSVSVKANKVSIKEVLTNITDPRFKRMFLIFLPIALIINTYYKLNCKNYWFK